MSNIYLPSCQPQMGDVVSSESLDLKTTDALLKSMFVFSRTVERVLQERASEAAQASISRSKFQILRLLRRRGPQNGAQIARFLSVTKPAITQIVTSMIEEGLVERTPSSEDRRQIHFSLTLEGRRTLREVVGKQRQFVRNAVRHLDATEARSWARQLDAMARALVRADRRFQDYCLQCGAHSNDSCVLAGGPAACLYIEMSSGSGSRDV